MYCDIEKLAAVEKELKGATMKGIFYDAAHANIYLQFYTESRDIKMLCIPNNFYGGLDFLPTAAEYAAKLYED